MLMETGSQFVSIPTAEIVQLADADGGNGFRNVRAVFKSSPKPKELEMLLEKKNKQTCVKNCVQLLLSTC